MKRFTKLFTALDETNRTNEKVAALVTYFRETAAADAVWALHFLSGRRLPRAITSTTLKAWASEAAGMPVWLFEECHHAVGDLAETVALLQPEAAAPIDLPLHTVISERLLPMHGASDSMRRELLLRTWRELSRTELFVWNKLLTGGFRIGVAQALVVRAVAAVAGIEQPEMAHRLLGEWQPTAADFVRLTSDSDSGAGEVARPYPFLLASPLEGAPASLGEIADWQAEWKWDGVRAQLIRRRGDVLIWSRGEEVVTDTFPEIAEAAHALPDGTVLDGEILAWSGDGPQSFARLQRRLGRKDVSARMRAAFPVILLAYDLLEWKGDDLRARPLHERRALLEKLMATAELNLLAKIGGEKWETRDLFQTAPPERAEFVLRLSEVLSPATWDDLAQLRLESRSRQVEGIMLKRRESAYGVGRRRGDWWKWKIDPLVIDAVMINAQLGHGRRASLYTDYTFAVWDAGKLVPVAKAYSGLSDTEILEVDSFVCENTTDKFGPIRAVKPLLVFELAFEGIQKSSRHKSGVAVRFPRVNRWRRDKKPEDADTLQNLLALTKWRE